MTRMISPTLPLWEPAVITTVSPLRTCLAMSHHLRREGDDLHVVLLPQLAGDGPEDARALGVPVLLDEDDGVGIELDVRAVRPAGRLGGADHHGLGLVALLDLGARERLLDRDKHAV